MLNITREGRKRGRKENPLQLAGVVGQDVESDGNISHEDADNGGMATVKSSI